MSKALLISKGVDVAGYGSLGLAAANVILEPLTRAFPSFFTDTMTMNLTGLIVFFVAAVGRIFINWVKEHDTQLLEGVFTEEKES